MSWAERYCVVVAFSLLANSVLVSGCRGVAPYPYGKSVVGLEREVGHVVQIANLLYYAYLDLPGWFVQNSTLQR